MTIRGTLRATLALVGLLLLSGSVGWFLTGPVDVDGPAFEPFAGVSCLLALVLAVFAGLRPARAPIVAPLYACAEGLAVGSIVCVYDARSHGVVLEAALAAIAVLATMIVLYATRVVHVDDRTRMRVLGAGLGLLVFWGVTVILALGGVEPTYLANPGVSLISVCVAAWFPALDFDMIEQGVRSRSPCHMEWQAALGLLVTMVWIFLELLALLGDGDE